jgi:hypothetical protein
MWFSDLNIEPAQTTIPTFPSAPGFDFLNSLQRGGLSGSPPMCTLPALLNSCPYDAKFRSSLDSGVNIQKNIHKQDLKRHLCTST